MIEKILERLEEKAVVNPIGGKIVKYVCISDIIDVVREVAKEYSEKACVRCKNHVVDADLKPCKYCIHLVKHIYKEDNFEPKEAPYQKGE